jgi:hypothetical protein
LFFSSTSGLRIAIVQRDTDKKLIATHRFAGASSVVNLDISVIELKTATDRVLQDLR